MQFFQIKRNLKNYFTVLDIDISTWYLVSNFQEFNPSLNKQEHMKMSR